MGHLTRTHNWAETALGTPDRWPQSLRTTLGIVLHSAFPMFLFWGTDLLCFYNDAYRPSLGTNGKHPAILGKPGKEAWPEIWDFIGPLIERVMATGEPVWFEDQLLPIFRNGQLEDVYWTFSYSPAYGDDGQINGVLVTCTETTEKVLNAKQQQETTTLLQAVFDSSAAGISVLKAVRNRGEGPNTDGPEQGDIIDFQYQLANRVTEQFNNRTDLVGQHYGAIHTAYKQAGLFDDFVRAVETGQPIQRKLHYSSEGLDNWYATTAVKNDDGVVLSFHDITAEQLSRQKIEESEQRFQAAIQAVEGILWTNNATGEMEGEQPGWANLTGQTYADYQGYGWASAVHPDDAQPTVDAWNEAVRERKTFVFEHRVRVKSGNWESFSIRAIPLINADGTIREWVGVHTNVTEQRKAEAALRASEQNLRSIVESAPFPIGVFMGRALQIASVNQAIIDIWGKGPNLVGKLVSEVLPEFENQQIIDQLTSVYDTGIPYHAENQQVVLVKDGKPQPGYYNYSFTPLFDATGQVYGVMNTGADITALAVAKRQIEASEQRFQNLIRDADVGIVVLTGPEMTVEIVNEAYGRLIDLTPAELLGKSLFSIIPEAEAYYRPLLNQVLNTGHPLYLSESPYSVRINGKQIAGFLNVTYQPYRENNNTITGVTALCQDVTEQVLARQKIEDAEVALRGAIEMAQLGTWSIDVATKGLTYSDRLIEWFGYDPGAQPYSEVIPILEEGDRERVEMAVAWALNPASDGVYNEVYTIIHPKTGQKRILHAQGKTVFDATGQAVRMNGTAQDITLQRELQLALEQQVQERTQQLQQSVQDLERSNQNLQQFAYIASHDLQEPLRKIQSFGDILKSQFASQLGEGIDYLTRMQTSASRMSTLIRDLLAYSRISTHQDSSVVVPLANVLDSVLSDLDLVIQETSAVVDVGSLPSLRGDPSQLGQLFQNLLNNALKFRKPGQPPRISVNCRVVAARELPPSVRPGRAAPAYYCINVADNGIGFNQQYAGRIFQVFQRLHGKSEYAGTGIGLAICEKVGTNHGGVITATSKPGEGATFSVYLPV